jgi:hypothetical protein
MDSRDWTGLDWIHLAQDRAQWMALAHTIVSHGVQ